MAVVTIVKTIGTSQDFATLQNWNDGAPADLTTIERWNAGTFVGTFQQGEALSWTGGTGKMLDTDGATYITFGITTGNTASLATITGGTSLATCIGSAKTFTGGIWQGKCALQEFSTSGINVTINGSTDSTTCYKDLTTKAGASFQDNTPRSVALTYNISNGAAIKRTGGYGNGVIRQQEPNVHISKLQVRADSVHALLSCIFHNNYSAVSCSSLYQDLLLYNNAGNFIQNPNGIGAKYINLICIAKGSSSNLGINPTRACTFIGCTIVRLSDSTPAANAWDTSGAYTASTLQSCASFGYTACAAGTMYDTTASKNNATDLASGWPGTTNNVYNVTFNSTTPFTQGSSSGTDIRSIASTALAAAGFLDSTNAPNDISATARANPPTIGHWEITGGAVAAPHQLTTLGVGSAFLAFLPKVLSWMKGIL